MSHDSLGFWLETAPVGCTLELSSRLKYAAKLIGKVTGQKRGHAFETLAQSLGFSSWHSLSQHLVRAHDFPDENAPISWVRKLALAVLLLVKTPPAVRVPLEILLAHERLAAALAMLTDTQPQRFLDGLCARLCGELEWSAVCERTPLRATASLYSFELDPDNRGRFVRSEACRDLVEELEDFGDDLLDREPEDQQSVRAWIAEALAAQPGFLEGSLYLAWLQHKASEREVATTLDRCIRQAEALIPVGYDGGLAWGSQDNRPYHRMLWLRMKIHHEHMELRPATAIARKLLALNPNDNLGVRYLLPMLLLQAGHASTAKRETRRFRNEHERECAAIRAFCAHALDHVQDFRRQMARALFTLPVLRLIILSQPGPLPGGDEGFRGTRPDLDTFIDFGWPVWQCMPGLLARCTAFLAEPAVLAAEEELRKAWRGFGRAGFPGAGSYMGWEAMIESWIDRLAAPSS